MFDNFIEHITLLSNFFLFYNFLEHIFEHIKGPLSGLFLITDKCRSKDFRGGAFSIRQKKDTMKTVDKNIKCKKLP